MSMNGISADILASSRLSNQLLLWDNDGQREASVKRILGVFVAALLLCTAALGWGKDGHRIIAAVAENYLDETTKVMVQSLIRNNHLYSSATWADEVKRQRPETRAWHYVNIPFGKTYDAKRDCGKPKGCVVTQIDAMVRVLMDKKAPREQRAEALKFLVHFISDIHQPMHGAKEAAGGNGVHVTFGGSKYCGRYECNLHGVWDTSIIRRTGLRQPEYVERVERIIVADKLAGGGTPEAWANESVKVAESAWVEDGAALDDEYYETSVKVVDRQMALASVRLAQMLNKTLGKMTPRDFHN